MGRKSEWRKMKTKILEIVRRQPRWRVAALALIVVLGLILLFSRAKSGETEITFAAKRGDLQISVLEGGSIEALESQEIRSEVKGSQGTKILKIVEEGYQVTDEDVKNGKVLVELDSADIKEKVIQEEIQFQSALASLTDAAQGYEIQRNQNISNIKAADQKAQFARMDAEKFLGDVSATEIIHALRLDKYAAVVAKLASGEEAEQMMLSAMETNETLAAESQQNASDNLTDDDKRAKPELTAASLPPKPKVQAPPVIDYDKYAKPEKLGDGAGMQQLRKLTDDLQSAKQQSGLSQTKLAGTKRLFEKGFANKTELDTDQISDDNNNLKVKTAQTAYDLFIKYEFPKSAQELISKYEEALRGLEREKKEAISKLAQAQAKLKGAESRYSIETAQRKALAEQLDNCTIKAERPGLVVYGGNSQERYGGEEQIREGATVRERQPIITIPNMARMSVKVKVHESYIQKVCKGLKAKIVVDAFPHENVTGEVIKVGLLPDSQNRWYNPDLKVYQTTVAIDGGYNWLKPGMSAKVELLVRQLRDVVYVPLQAVTENNGKHFCQVINGKSEKREVEIGEFNDEFIEIKRGLNLGEKVSLRAPEAEVAETVAASENLASVAPTDAKPKPVKKMEKKSDKKPVIK